MALDIEKVETLVMEAEEKFEKTSDVFRSDLTQVRAGRANPHVLDKIRVDYYGTPSPINQVGNIAVQDGQCLVISPWDKSLLKEIEKAIQVSDIGINPTNDGNVIRLVFPVLTEERRKDIVKQVKKMSEDAKVAVRNIRRDYLDVFKKMNKNKEMTDDEYADYEAQIEKLVASAMGEVEKATSEKEKELMTV
ncbi:MAG: ribosome recycling factor [Candidatus Borkfalkiaceae bacterium]|nr:ribosome recycling factor [Eubacteriales bacterium]MDY5820144.1 ribosome recycling factor [Christensenellaceae bacterium]